MELIDHGVHVWMLVMFKFSLIYWNKLCWVCPFLWFMLD